MEFLCIRQEINCDAKLTIVTIIEEQVYISISVVPVETYIAIVLQCNETIIITDTESIRKG